MKFPTFTPDHSEFLDQAYVGRVKARHGRENFLILGFLVIMLTGFSGMLLAEVVSLNKVVSDVSDMCIVRD